MGKSTKLKRVLQKLAVMLAIILAVPSTPMPSLNGSSITEVHAEGINEPYFTLQYVDVKPDNEINIGFYIGDGGTTFGLPTGTIKVEYSTDEMEVNAGNLVSADTYTWSPLIDAVGFDSENPVYSAIIPEAIKGKIVTLRGTYSGDENYKSMKSYYKADFQAPVISSISSITETSTTGQYTFDINLGLQEVEGTFFCCLLTPYDENGYTDKAEEVVETVLQKAQNDEKGFINLEGSIRLSALDGLKATATFTADDVGIDEGIYVFQVAAKDWTGNISNKMVTEPFSIGKTVFTKDDINASLKEDEILEYEFDENGAKEQIPEVILSAKSTDVSKKDPINNWISSAIADNKISYSYCQITDGNNNPVTGVVSGGAVRFAGTYQVYVSTTDSNVALAPGVYGTIEVLKLIQENPEGKVKLNYVYSETDKKYTVTIDTTEVLNSTGKTIEYSFDETVFGNEKAIVADPGTTVTGSIRFAGSENIEESDYITAELELPSNNNLYTSSDISAALDSTKQMVYSGEYQMPVIILSAISTDDGRKKAVENFIKKRNNKSLSFKQIKDGLGNAIIGAEPYSQVKNAGIYEIYITSDDPSVVIASQPIGTLTVARSKTAPDSDTTPKLLLDVSEDKKAYVVSVDTSLIKNAAGKVFEYSFEEVGESELSTSGEATPSYQFIKNNSFTIGAEKKVVARIRFADSVNSEETGFVVSDLIDTPKASVQPIISRVYVENVLMGRISADRSNVTDTSLIGIYYTTDGTEPTLESINTTDVANFVLKEENTVVKAFAVELGKIMSPVVTAELSNQVSYNEETSDDVETVDIIHVTSLNLSKKSATLHPDESLVIKASVSPYDSTNKEVEWSVNPENVIKLDKKSTTGSEAITVTGINEGTAVITAVSKDDSSLKATFTVTVAHDWKFSGFTWKKRFTKVSGSFICDSCQKKLAANIYTVISTRGTGDDAITAKTVTVKEYPNGKKLAKLITETKYIRANGKETNKEEFDKLLTAKEEDDDSIWNLFYIKEDGITIPIGDTILTNAEGELVPVAKSKFVDYYDVEPVEVLSNDGTNQNGLKISLKSELTPDYKTTIDKKEITNILNKRKKAGNAANSLLSFVMFDKNGNEIGQYQYQVPVVYTKPSLKLSSTKGSISIYVTAAKQPLYTTVTIKKSNGIYEALDLSTLQDIDTLFESKNAKITVELGENVGELVLISSEVGSGKFRIRLKDWCETIELSYTVKSNNKDVIMISKNGSLPSEKAEVILNVNANQGGNPDPIELEVFLNGSNVFDEKTITVPQFKKAIENAGFEIEGIEVDPNSKKGDGYLKSSVITIKYPEKTVNMRTQTLKLTTSKKGSISVKINVVKSSLEKAVNLKEQAKLDLVTDENLIYIPTLKGIDGKITNVSFEEGEKVFKAKYDEQKGEIIVSVKKGKEDKVKTDTYIKTLYLTVGGVKCSTKVKFKPIKTKPTINISKLILPKSGIIDGTAEGKAYVRCTYKKNNTTFSIKPKKVEFQYAVKNEELGKGWYTISNEKKGTVYVKYDDKEGTILVKSGQNSSGNLPPIKVDLYFNGANRSVDPLVKVDSVKISKK